MDNGGAFTEQIAKVAPLKLTALGVFVNPVRLVHKVDTEKIFVFAVTFAEFFYILLGVVVTFFFACGKLAPLFCGAVCVFEMVE